MRTLPLAVVLLSFAAYARDVSPETVAKVKREQKAADEKVAAKYGNKKAGEMSKDEKKAMAKEMAEAEQKVLKENNIDPKAFARSEAKQTVEERAATNAAVEAGDKKDKEEAEKKAADAKKPKDGKKEIIVEKNGKVTQGAGEVNEAADMDKAAGLGKGK